MEFVDEEIELLDDEVRSLIKSDEEDEDFKELLLF
jgi:hypothetical protein